MPAFCLGGNDPPERGQTMKETDISFLRRQAEHCIALSRTTFDLTIASRLRAMADEFRARASHRDLHGEDEIGHLPARLATRNGVPNGKP